MPITPECSDDDNIIREHIEMYGFISKVVRSNGLLAP